MLSRRNRNRIVLTSLIVASLGAPGAANADREKGGNGGNAAVCFNSTAEVRRIKANDNRIANDQLSKIVSIQALELYQADAAFRDGVPAGALVLPKPGEDGMDYVERIARRFDTTLPGLSDAIRSTAATFDPKHYSYYTKGGIDRIYDTAEKYYLDPGRCVIATLINRTTVGGEVRLEFDWRLFNHRKHSPSSRGVILLHEVIYQWANALKQTDSKGTRDLIANALIRSGIDRRSLLQELTNDGFPVSFGSPNDTAEYRAFLLKVESVFERGESESVSTGFLDSLRSLGQAGIFSRARIGDHRKGLRRAGIALATEKPYWSALSHPREPELAAFRNRISELSGTIRYCETERSSQTASQRKSCRRHLEEWKKELPSVQAQEKAVALQIETDLKALTPRLQSLVNSEFDRLVTSNPYDRIQDGAREFGALEWIDPGIRKGVSDYVDCLKGDFSPPTSTPETCEDPDFSVVFGENPIIPVIE